MEDDQLVLQQETPLMDENKENITKPNSSKIYEKLKKLNKKRKTLEKKKKYILAGKTSLEIKKLGKHFKSEILQEIRIRQLQEKQNLEYEYKTEFTKLLNLWDQKLEENEKEIKAIVDEIHEKQKKELLSYEKELRNQYEIEKKKTSEILDLEFMIEKLVKKQKYLEAGTLQKKVDFLEKNSKIKKNEIFEKKIRNLLEFLIKKHDNELSAYDLKLGAERNKIMKLKETDFEIVDNKFKVLRGNLEVSQKLEVNKEKKKLRSFKPNSDFL